MSALLFLVMTTFTILIMISWGAVKLNGYFEIHKDILITMQAQMMDFLREATDPERRERIKEAKSTIS
jgi:hypothetical protein